MIILFKVSGIALVLLCTTSIGISLARNLSRRVTELETAIAVLCAMEQELSCQFTPPDQAVAQLEQMESLQDATYLPACASLCRQGIPFPRAWKQAVQSQRGELQNEEVRILAGLSEVLGQCDLGSQLARLQQAQTQLGLRAEAARERCTTHAKLYRTMGLLTGAFLVIILV